VAEQEVIQKTYERILKDIKDLFACIETSDEGDKGELALALICEIAERANNSKSEVVKLLENCIAMYTDEFNNELDCNSG